MKNDNYPRGFKLLLRVHGLTHKRSRFGMPYRHIQVQKAAFTYFKSIT